MRYAYGVTAALLLGGTVATLALQSPATSQAPAVPEGVSLTSAPRPGAPMSFADLAAKLQPAVVNIATEQKVAIGRTFDPFGGYSGPQVQEQQGGGSGFIISSDGYIVTNNHVIARGDESRGPGSSESSKLVDKITVKLSDRREYKATVVGRDEQSDLAVLKIEATGLSFVQFGDSAKTRVGDWVIAIGNPLGLSSTVTAGIVSAMQRNTGSGGAYDRFIQTDTAINRGNSGGPLFDLNGKVVGINNRLMSPVGVNIGLNFAIPADAAIPVVEALKKGAKVTRGYLGVSVRPVEEDIASALGVAKERGEIIDGISAGKPADKAGLKEGDVVLKVNGKDVQPGQSVSYLVANVRPGATIPIEIMRDGKPMTLSATIIARDDAVASSTPSTSVGKSGPLPKGGKASSDQLIRSTLGMEVIPFTAALAERIGVAATTKGVVISDLAESSDAARRGFRPGDVIMGVNYRPIVDINGLASSITAAKSAGRPAIILQIRRSDIESANVAVRISD